MRKMMKSIAAVLAVSALMAGSAFAADKLIVKDSTGATDVFKVADDGTVTVSNKTASNANNLFKIQNIAGVDTYTVQPQGFINVYGEGTGQQTIMNHVGLAGTPTSLPNARPNFEAYRLRGTIASPAAVLQNDKLGTFGFAGYDGSGNITTGKISGALLEVFVDGPVSTGYVPQRMSIVTGTSFSNRAERLVIKYDGKVGIGTNAPTSILQVVGLPVYADNAAALAGGLTAGAFYRTSTGQLMVAY